MKVLVCGDRHYADRAAVFATLDDLNGRDGISLVIEGEAPGADTFGREWGEVHNVPIARFPADWDKYGRAAGPIRNRQMLVEGQPDLVVYFHDDLAHSKGTADMVRQAMKAGVSVTRGGAL